MPCRSPKLAALVARNGPPDHFAGAPRTIARGAQLLKALRNAATRPAVANMTLPTHTSALTAPRPVETSLLSLVIAAHTALLSAFISARRSSIALRIWAWETVSIMG